MRPRIYLIEHHPVVLESIADWFRELKDVRLVGFSFSEEEALEWLAEHKAGWDLAVVDIDLKQGSGFNVLKGLQDRTLKQKVVVFSNITRPAIRDRCLLLGADAVFDKSNELEEFSRYAMDEIERQQGDTNV